MCQIRRLSLVVPSNYDHAKKSFQKHTFFVVNKTRFFISKLMSYYCLINELIIHPKAAPISQSFYSQNITLFFAINLFEILKMIHII